MKMPKPKAQKDTYRMKLLNSRESGEGAGWRRAARPATRPRAVKSPQHSTTPKSLQKILKTIHWNHIIEQTK